MRCSLLIAVLFVGCHHEREVTPSGGEDCIAACVQVRVICAAQECPDDIVRMSAPTPEGQPCEVWRCRQNYPAEKNTCIARARTSSEVRACNGVGR